MRTCGETCCVALGALAAVAGRGAGERAWRRRRPRRRAGNPWVRLAPFPNPSEEVLGATANGKLYVFAGLAPGWKPKALVHEYDPAANQWAQKKPMPLASHHVAFATLNNKIYAFGGFRLPESGPPAWEPLDNAWEYDPATDEWKALRADADQARRRGGAVANGKIYVIGGATIAARLDRDRHPSGAPHMVVGDRRGIRPGDQHAGAPALAADAAQPSRRRPASGDKIYVIGGRIGAAFITSGSNNVDLVESYDPATDLWTPPRDSMPTRRSAMGDRRLQRPDHRGGRRIPGPLRMLGAFRAVEAYDPAVNRWSDPAVDALSAPRARRSA